MPEYGLPQEVKFCKRCVMPNTRAVASNEYKHVQARPHRYIQFDDEGVCSACRYSESYWSAKADWKEREKELLDLLSRHRSNDGSYDCIVPGSGGKDSVYASHILKYKYGMHPLTVTWAPHLYTDIGFRNFENWTHVGGFDNYLFTPNGRVHGLLTRNAFLNLMHPFQPFVLGQKTFATKMASLFNIPLIFYGENPGQYGANMRSDQKKFALGSDQGDGHRLDFVTSSTPPGEIFLGGKSVAQYMEEGLARQDLEPYLPLDPEIAVRKNIEFHFLGYYLKWVSQEAYYYAVENAAFQANPVRSEGTYSKYSSLDDKVDGFFYYSTYIKFGYGRASMDAAQEVRNGHITREEAVALVKKFDGEFPARHFETFLKYVSLTEDEFHAACDRFRSPRIWEKADGEWRLRHAVWKDAP